MSIDLYYSPLAPTTSIIKQLATSLGLVVNEIVVDVHKGATKTPEFRRINPQHCVPTIVDDGFVLWESRAIYAYLANAYDKTGKLYPSDPKKRAKVDEKLFFDIGTLYQRLKYLFQNIPRDPENSKEEGLDLLENDLSKHTFVTGDEITIADYAIVVSVACFDAVGIRIAKYPNISQWTKQLQLRGIGVPKNIVEGLREMFAKPS